MRLLGTLLRARIRVVANAFVSLGRESRLKLAFIATMLTLLWLGAFAVARAALRALEALGTDILGGAMVALAPLLVPRLLAVFALVLLIMLAFSSALLALALLYRSRETTHLLTVPLTWRAVCLTRLGDVAFFSSWSSAYLGSPVLLAYGLHVHAPWPFYCFAAALFVPFVVIPAALGTIMTMVVVRVAPRLPRVVLVAAGIVLVAATFLAFRSRLSSPDFHDAIDLTPVAELTGKAQSPLLPSAWLADGIVAAAYGNPGAIVFPFLLLLAHALVLAWLAGEVAERLLHPGWSGLASAAHARRMPEKVSRGWLPLLLRPLPEPVRALVLKDIRVFARDVSQWSQVVLFFGVLAFYVANIRTAARGFSLVFWQSWITMLNTVACLLVLATLTTRFVFPLVSLEGRRFWILGLAPLRIATIVRQKFWLAVVFSAGVTVSLTAASSWRLRLAPVPFVITVLTVCAASFALSGLAVGLGSLYPDFTADSPARIVSGTGGTLTFLVSLVYITVVASAETYVLRWRDVSPWSAAAAAAAIAIVSLAATTIPLRLGVANLERSDF